MLLNLATVLPLMDASARLSQALHHRQQILDARN
jgi:hypothetical protein